MFLLLLLLPVENVTAAGTDSQAVFRACDDSRGLLMGGSSSLRKAKLNRGVGSLGLGRDETCIGRRR